MVSGERYSIVGYECCLTVAGQALFILLSTSCEMIYLVL